MMRNGFALAVIFVALLSSASWAQRGGARPPGQAPGGSAPPEDAKKAKLVDEIRTTLPQHPPIAKNPWPTKNAQMLGRLLFAEQPRADLTRYLDTLWNQSQDAVVRRATISALWDEAEKPKWARAAIEEFFRQHASGLELRPPPEAPAAAPAAPHPPPPTPPPAGTR
jgi:hypothetical protein